MLIDLVCLIALAEDTVLEARRFANTLAAAQTACPLAMISAATDPTSRRGAAGA